MNNKKKRYGISVGTSSILVIIVVLCLVCFAGLSIVSANADYKLSSKLAERTTSYYQASSLANEEFAKINNAFYDFYLESADSDEYYKKIKESYSDSLTFSYPISSTQALSVSVEPVYPDDETGNFFNVTSFCIVTTSDLQLDESLPVLFHD
ncbi:MAG: hypothetical protein J6C64_15970 [Lachnospiraceae bacterium]|nr:hypothetical protein [Lachnospiraceae bacterium]